MAQLRTTGLLFRSGALKPRLLEIARRLQVDCPSWMTVPEIRGRISSSLARRDGQGWRGAVGAVLDELNGAEICDALTGYPYDIPGRGEYELASGRHAAPDLRAVAYHLVVALDREASSADVAALFALPSTASMLVAVNGEEFDNNDVDGDDSGDDDDGPSPNGQDDSAWTEAAVADDTVAPWHEELFFTVGPGLPAPPDLPYAPMALRPHQLRAVDNLTAWWQDPNQRAGVLCLPTGAGKTRTAVAFALAQAVASEAKVLWLAHRRELVDQAMAAFVEAASAAGRDFTIGRFEAGRRRYKGEADVVVASLPTLAWGRHSGLPNVDELHNLHGVFDLVVIDECHHAPAVTWRKVIQKLVGRRRTKLLGLTATPTRSSDDEKTVLWQQFHRVIHEEHILDMVKAGILAEPVVYPVATGRTFDADANERREYARFRDLPPSMVKRIANDAARNRLVVSTYTAEPTKWGQTLVFAATVEQARALRAALTRTGVAVDELYASDHRDRRTMVLRAFRDRQIRVLINVMLFAEGTDVPGVDSVFIARPTQSQTLFQQMVGRGLRGPEFEGTRVCNVVAFHDAVQGLEDLMSDQLAATYTDEASVLHALGITPEDQRRPDVNPHGGTAGEPATSGGDGELRLAAELGRLRAALAAMPQQAPAGTTSIAVHLAGWWEIRGVRRVFLPTMEHDRAALQRYVRDLNAAMYRGETARPAAPTLQWIERSRIDAFGATVIAQGQQPTWHDLTTATVAEVVTVIDAVTGVGTGVASLQPVVEPEPPPLPVAPPPPPATPPAPTAAAPAAAPAWIPRATAVLASRAAGTSLVELDGGLAAISPDILVALGRLWAQARRFVRTGASDAEVLHVATMACADLDPALSPEMQAEVARTIARTGEVPAAIAQPTEPPPLTDVAAELRRVPAAHRSESVRDLHAAFFADAYAQREDFLIALLGA